LEILAKTSSNDCGPSPVIKKLPGPNPMIASYNASAVKIYNVMHSLMRLENKNTFFSFE
jgi:hypothetical protein